MKTYGSSGLQLLPGWVRDHKISCSKCNFRGRIDEQVWFQKYDRKSFELPGMPELSRQVLVDPPTARCPQCLEDVLIVPPFADHIATVDLHVHETNRSLLNGRKMYVFSAVGVDRRSLTELNERVQAIKRMVEPNHDATQWVIHMKVISSGQRRERHPIFRGWKREQVELLKMELFALMRWDYTLKFAAIVPHENQESWAKEVAFHLLVLSTANALGRIGRVPVLRFDSQRPVKSGKEGSPIVHGWAAGFIQRFRGVLLYQFLSRLLEIPEPVFVRPGSAPLAELADFSAFVIGRSIEQRARGESLDYDAFELGFVNWVGMMGIVGARSIPAIGVPVEFQ